jgi:hypothetical protein
VYSTDTEKDARLLVTMACKRDLDGIVYAPDLINPETQTPYTGDKRIQAFESFGDRLAEIEEMIIRRRKDDND